MILGSPSEATEERANAKARNINFNEKTSMTATRSKYVALAFLLGVAALAGGCAGSNASRSSYDTNQTLSLAQIRGSGADLASAIVSDSNFIDFKKAEAAEGRTKVIVMVQALDGDAMMDRTWNTQLLFDSLEEYLLNNGMFFQQCLDPGYPNYVSGANRLSKQDSDARYNRANAKVITGGALPAVAKLQLIATKVKIANDVEIDLRAKIIDGETELPITSVSVYTKNPGSKGR